MGSSPTPGTNPPEADGNPKSRIPTGVTVEYPQMLKAKIKGIDCSDVPEFRTWVPSSPSQVYLPITLSIGMEDSRGAEFFGIVIATSQGMQGKPERRNAKLLMVRSYVWSEIETILTSWVEGSTGVSWPQIVDELRKKFDWEYEGMGPPVLGDPVR